MKLIFGGQLADELFEGEAVVRDHLHLGIAGEQGMDLILLSVPPERTATMGERVFGTTVDHVVRHAPCPVWTLRGGQLAPEESPPAGPDAGTAAE